MKNEPGRSLFFCLTFFCLVLRALSARSSSEFVTVAVNALHSALRVHEPGLPLALLIVNRQMDRERAALAGFAPHGDFALMGHDYVFDQRQSEAASFHVVNQAG